MNEQQLVDILHILNATSDAFQATMTEEERTALQARKSEEPQTVEYAAGSREDAMLAFTIDAGKALIDDIESVLEQRRARLYRDAMEIYYAAEELSRQPEHAHLIEHVEAMRRAHEEEYGCPPPPRQP